MAKTAQERSASLSTTGAAPEVVIPVEATTPTRGDIAMYFETTTRVEAERMVDVSAKASGRCEKVFVEVGDFVKTGQVIAELEKNEAQALYSQSDVMMRKNQTSYEVAKRQFEEGLGPKVEMDNARYTFEQSQATLESQKILLENLTVHAPIDGVITSRDVQTGMLVNMGQKTFRIVDPTSFQVTISPPERELPRLKVGQKAKVTIDALRGKEFDAEIRRINPSVDPVSGTVKVVLDFDEEVRKSLHESAFARVKLVMATLQGVLLAPKEALLDEEGRHYVFVARAPKNEAAKDGPTDAPQAVDAPKDKAAAGDVYVAERVEVQTGLEDSDRVQIVSGVAEGDLLITNGQHTLKPGSKVRVTTTHEAVFQNAAVSADEALARAEEKRAAGGGKSSASAGSGGGPGRHGG
jgi:RND family efflux transporter MFP subunit